MADVEKELQALDEAEVRLALIRRQIEDIERLIEETHDPRILNSYRRTLQLLTRTQQAFSDHRMALIDSMGRMQQAERVRDEPAPLRRPSGAVGHWEQW